jgi:opacity protein-like surface antigen
MVAGVHARSKAARFHVKHIGAALTAVLLSLASAQSHAQERQAPLLQWNASFTLGAATYGDNNDLWRSTRFATSARVETFLGRKNNRSFGFGPAAFLGASTLTEATIGGGLQALVPIHELLPIVVGAGAYGVDRENQSPRPGVFASLGWGLRSFNFHSSYAMALPVVWAINAFR